ncbi:MAG: peptidoglycan-binding domain-containing protein [Patescibacteria group bacterium]
MKNYIQKGFVILAALLIVGIQIAKAETYTRDLTLGSTGNEVISLQTFLESKGYLIMPTGVAKGYFGARTKVALISYQKSINFPAFGFFGAMTRKHLNDSDLDVQTAALKITSPNGGENWKKGTTQNITWTAPQYLKATYVDVRLMSYQAPCLPGYVCPAYSAPLMNYEIGSNININQKLLAWYVGMTVPAPCPSGYSCSPLPSPADGQYKVQICEAGTTNCDVSDNPFTISSSTVEPSVTVTSPNGGEVWDINSHRQIAWNYVSKASDGKVDIYLETVQVCPKSPYVYEAVCSPVQAITLDTNIPVETVYTWIVGTDIVNKYIPAGNYRMKVCIAGTNKCDLSDNDFILRTLTY